MDFTNKDVRRLVTKPVTSSRVRKRVTLLGAGGVGSNIIRTMCRTPTSMFLTDLHDFDTVELHNLNRSTMFGAFHTVGLTKVRVIRNSAQKLANADAKRSPVSERVFLTPVTKSTEFTSSGVIIDARDTMDPNMIPPNTWLKLAYDGGSDVSFTWLPAIVADKLFDLTPTNRSTYEIVPSFYVPAAMLGILALRFMEFPSFTDITELRAGTFTCSLDSIADNVSYRWEDENVND